LFGAASERAHFNAGGLLEPGIERTVGVVVAGGVDVDEILF
jgi:hypothetical protein